MEFNLGNFLLAMAPPPGTQPDPKGEMIKLVGMLGLMAVMFYFVAMRPQQKRAKEQAERINSVKRGDNVVLSNGMLGKVVRVEDTEVGVEIATGVTVKVIKSMVADIRAKGDPAPANDSKG